MANPDGFNHGISRARSKIVTAIALLSALVTTFQAQVQDRSASLAEQSAIVVLGTVLKIGTSEEPLLSPTGSTVVIRIRKMYAGSEFAGDQTGRTATVVLSKQGSVRAGGTFLFFGNPRFIGKTLTMADVGELPAPKTETAVLQGIQKRRDAPIRARLAVADMVFRGRVESIRPLEGPETNDKSQYLRDEHDPDWHLAKLRVTAAMRGTQGGAEVPVVFPASGDILWINSPKLRAGEEVLVLAHRPQEDEVRLLRSAKAFSQVEETHARVVSKPFDVLPVSQEKHLFGLMQAQEVK